MANVVILGKIEIVERKRKLAPKYTCIYCGYTTSASIKEDVCDECEYYIHMNEVEKANYNKTIKEYLDTL